MKRVMAPAERRIMLAKIRENPCLKRAELLERGMNKVFLDACALYERSKQLLRMTERELRILKERN